MADHDGHHAGKVTGGDDDPGHGGCETVLLLQRGQGPSDVNPHANLEHEEEGQAEAKRYWTVEETHRQERSGNVFLNRFQTQCTSQWCLVWLSAKKKNNTTIIEIC